MQHYRKKSGTDSFKTRRYSSPLYFTLSRFYQKTVFEHASEHQRNETSQFCEHTASTQLRIFYKTENHMDWLKKNLMRKNCQKILLTDVAEQIKPVYKTNCSRKKNFDRIITTSVPKKVFAKQGKTFSCKRQGQADLGQNKLKRYTGEHLPI